MTQNRRSFLARLAGALAGAVAAKRLPAAEPKKPVVMRGTDLRMTADGRDAYGGNRASSESGRSGTTESFISLDAAPVEINGLPCMAVAYQFRTLRRQNLEDPVRSGYGWVQTRTPIPGFRGEYDVHDWAQDGRLLSTYHGYVVVRGDPLVP